MSTPPFIFICFKRRNRFFFAWNLCIFDPYHTLTVCSVKQSLWNFCLRILKLNAYWVYVVGYVFGINCPKDKDFKRTAYSYYWYAVEKRQFKLIQIINKM